MWFTRDDQGFRCWFTIEVGGELRPGLVNADFTTTVVNPSDSAKVMPWVSESVQRTGLYYLDVTSSFLTTHGVGYYPIVVEINTISGSSGFPEVIASFGDALRVTQEDFDTLAKPGDAMGLTAGAVDAVWDEIASTHQTSGSLGQHLSLMDTAVSSRAAGGAGLTSTQQTMLLELYRLMGLDPTKPLVVTSTTRAAGAEISQTIAENAGQVTVTRQ